METWVTCQCHKAKATSCTLFSQPHRPFSSKTRPQRKLAVLLPEEIQGCAPSVPPSPAPVGLGCSSSGSPWRRVHFAPFPGHSVSVQVATCKPTGVCTPDLFVHVSCRAHHRLSREVHMDVLEVFKIKISCKLLQHDTKALQEHGKVPTNAEIRTHACQLSLQWMASASSGDRAAHFDRHLFPRVGTSPIGRQRLLHKFGPCISCDKTFSLVLQVSFGLCWPPAWLAASPGCWTVAASEWICFPIPHAKPFPPRC